MIRLNDGTLLRVHALIERYGMHEDDAPLPVSIVQVARHEGWRIEYRGRMGSAVAMAFVVGPIKLMYLNENLSTAAQRTGIAHEMGHVLCRHGVSADALMTFGHEAEGWTDANVRQEEEAKMVAALLLIPAWVIDSPLSDAEVAMTCSVTRGSVLRVRGSLPEQALMTGA
jgi:hypothetical protein